MSTRVRVWRRIELGYLATTEVVVGSTPSCGVRPRPDTCSTRFRIWCSTGHLHGLTTVDVIGQVVTLILQVVVALAVALARDGAS
ncbi:hypothetical protein [Microbispora sp. H10836]|uniref:hypothetical protein n=1 Tax=Microbispora sp. H10836 TaxID=2729106 RepID=UPI001475C87F|nr:hypothetical protein [Microbispora sp. H10836]